MSVKKVIFIALATLVVLAAIGLIFREQILREYFTPTETTLEQPATPREAVSIVATGLDIPWEVAFLPGGDYLVTERAGILKHLNTEGQVQAEHAIAGVSHSGEGGLLGLALHPDYSDNHWLYLYSTTRTAGAGLSNRVERYTYQNGQLDQRTVIIQDIPGANIHNGGRIAFGPDGYLYITTGDAAVPGLAQDQNSLAGKILRLTDEGDIPLDNPFDSPVFSLGHRNPQGLAWDEQERLWATEHGPVGFDELNLIEAGANYGWPEIQGEETGAGMRAPVAHSGADDTWAPSGLAYYENTLYFAGLRGNGLYEARIEGGDSVSLRVHLRTDFGRLRAVRLGPDNFIYITTSNRDGRGSPEANDDRIIRLDPGQLNRQ